MDRSSSTTWSRLTSDRVVKLAFTSQGWVDYRHWQDHDRSILKRLNRLLEGLLRIPAAGIGKPERLRHMGPDVWSRRIIEEHRLVYLVDGDTVVILQARYHYE